MTRINEGVVVKASESGGQTFHRLAPPLHASDRGKRASGQFDDDSGRFSRMRLSEGGTQVPICKGDKKNLVNA